MKRIYYKVLVTFAYCFLLATLTCNAQTYTILYTSQLPGGNDELAMMEVKGEQRLLINHLAKDSSPDLSPDGKSLVFTSERQGWWKIWLMDLKTGSYKQLTNSASAEYGPCFSPDGKQILFTSGRSGNSDLFIMDRDGANLFNLTQSAEAEGNGYWAHDGFIYYASQLDGKYQLMRINPNGEGAEVLSDGTSDDLGPRLSPDGKRLVFYSYRFGNPEVCVMNLKTRKVTRLTEHPLQDIRPDWSPDGRKIVFERGDKRKDQQLYWMNADGSGLERLTSGGYNYAPVFAKEISYLKAY